MPSGCLGVPWRLAGRRVGVWVGVWVVLRGPARRLVWRSARELGWGAVRRDARTVAVAERTTTIVLVAAGLMVPVKLRRIPSTVVGGGHPPPPPLPTSTLHPTYVTLGRSMYTVCEKNNRDSVVKR